MISEIVKVDPIVAGWEWDAVNAERFTYRIIFSKDLNAFSKELRGLVRTQPFERNGFIDSEDFMLFITLEKNGNDEAYIGDMGKLIAMKMTGDEQVQRMLANIIKIEERK